MKSSFVALVAIAGLAGGMTSAQAADLGGDCCADLEERVAELEATTARKGNRKVSLTVSGFVNEAVMWFDDGFESNIYQGTNEVARTRFRFVGNAKINADWSAGYLLEFGATAARWSHMDADTDDGGADVSVRHSAWWLANKQLGKVWVGQTSSATDGITEINLANTGHFATQNANGQVGNFRESITGLRLRQFMGGTGNNGSSDGAEIGEGTRHNVVKYESPTFAGFALSAAAGEDDLWDVALRYAGEFSGFKIAAGIGYMQWTDGTTNQYNCVTGFGVNDIKCSQLGMSGAIMHVPTGLYVHAAYGIRSDDRVPVGFDDQSTQLYIQAGIEQNFTGIGKTTLFGEYQDFDVGTTNTNFDLGMTMWGIGFNQAIDAAAMDLYIRYNNWDPDVPGIATESFQSVIAGGRISF